jgi:hypothetical protein
VTARSASEMLREWEVISTFYVVRGEKVRTYRIGDCCKVAGVRGVWRIIGADRNRYNRQVRVRLRHEQVFIRKRTEDASLLRWLRPPYTV